MKFKEYNEVTLNANANKTLTDENELTRVDRSQPEFVSLKELARRFCLSFGPEASVKSREAIVAIHHEAIKYVNEASSGQDSQRAPSNISFLDVISEFSSRLTSQDKKSMYITNKFFNKNFEFNSN